MSIGSVIEYQTLLKISLSLTYLKELVYLKLSDDSLGHQFLNLGLF